MLRHPNWPSPWLCGAGALIVVYVPILWLTPVGSFFHVASGPFAWIGAIMVLLSSHHAERRFQRSPTPVRPHDLCLGMSKADYWRSLRARIWFRSVAGLEAVFPYHRIPGDIARLNIEVLRLAKPLVSAADRAEIASLISDLSRIAESEVAYVTFTEYRELHFRLYRLFVKYERLFESEPATVDGDLGDSGSA